METDYLVTVKEKNGQYRLRIRELFLTVHGNDLGAVYAEIQRRKQEIIKEAADAGELYELPEPRHGAAGRLGAPRRRPWLRAAIWAVAAVVVVMLAAQGVKKVNRAIERASAQVHKLADRLHRPNGWHVLDRLEQEIEGAADPANDMDPAKKERLLKSLAILVQRVKPFTDELAPLIPPPQEASTPPAATAPTAAPPRARKP